MLSSCHVLITDADKSQMGIVRNYYRPKMTPQAVVHEQPGVHAMRVGFDNSYFGKEEKFNVIKRIALSYHSLVLQVDQL